MTQSKKMNFSTGSGIAQYPWLTKPDYAFDSNGQYKVNLKVPANDAKALMDEIKGIAKDEFGDQAGNARMPWKKDAETGEIVIVTKSKFKPKIVDSAGHMIRDDQTPPIYGGSTLKLAGTIYPYKQGGSVGVSLQLAGVQIIDLVSEGQGGPAVSFAPVEGGFIAANDNAEAEEAKTGEGDSYNF